MPIFSDCTLSVPTPLRRAELTELAAEAVN